MLPQLVRQGRQYRIFQLEHRQLFPDQCQHHFCLCFVSPYLQSIAITPFGQPKFVCGEGARINGCDPDRQAIIRNRQCFEGWRILQPDQPFNRLRREIVIFIAMIDGNNIIRLMVVIIIDGIRKPGTPQLWTEWALRVHRRD